jgi:hypothetical protein
MKTEVYYIVKSGRARYYFRIEVAGRIIDMPMKDEDALSSEVQEAYGEIPEYTTDPELMEQEEKPKKGKTKTEEE